NRLWALPQAIESCRATKAEHEIIVVDDGGTDGTFEWLAKQPDVIAVRTDNWGKDWAVNKAFAMARGQYVRFLDSDDWLEPEANDAQLEIGMREDADIVVAGYRTVDDRTNESVLAPWNPSDDFIAQQMGDSQSGHYSAFLFKRSFIGDVPHRPEFLANDDRMFILEASLKHPKLAVWDKLALVHRHHDRGRLQAPRPAEEAPMHLAEVKIYRKVMTLLAARGELTERRRRAPAAKLWQIAHQIARYDVEEAAELARWVRELDPDFQVPGTGLLPATYRALDFRTAARLLNLRRRLLRPLRALAR
ncbi:MAG TPA: glycosyltransferase family 2 protein, partial [Reyranella sp.]|nr:glycosyltransferase family 2 protein [Reyranella sp.]